MIKQYEKNQLSVIRQARYNEEGKSVDLLLCLNGLPVATGEIKNPLTGQNFNDAIRQYEQDRDPREPLFSFKTGALVHFAIDTEEIHMTTRLNKEKTIFLPFNKGRDEGRGNPDNPNGYRTSYLWEEIWKKDTWINIIENFVSLQIIEQKPPLLPKEILIFPRFHQLDSVTELTKTTKKEGPGKNYLIQHSTGSGKSNTIAWLAYDLFSLHTDQDRPMFDSILVLSDRIGIVNQLGSTIMQFEQTSGVVLEVKDSAQLTENLGEGRKILVSTQQKFPYVLEEIRKRKGKFFAIIIDEAHSSQSGDTATTVKKVLTADLEEAAKAEQKNESGKKDITDQIQKEMQDRGRQENLSYYAFTATPKSITLELFGRKDPTTGEFIPFHTYSMKQAIGEGFILDVLKNYTTFEAYFHIVKTSPEDKTVEGKKASRALMKYVETHHKSVSEKTALIVEHFRVHVLHKIGGLAKAMVVASSRLQALRYKQEIDDYVSKNNVSGIKTLVAFSGSLKDESTGTVYTEQNLNDTKSEEELREKFDTPEFNILIVAEKYQTGFDQPLLHTMYVDKPLYGIKAVQTLSRLNRIHPGKTETFVLDFQNTAEDIQKSYKKYYETTILLDKTSPDYLFKLFEEILDFEIITQHDLDEFANVFFGEKDKSVLHRLLYAKLDPILDRFTEREETEQEELKSKIRKYIEAYSFLSQVVTYSDVNLEKLFVVSKYLINTRQFRTIGTMIPELKGDISLEWYKLEKKYEGEIVLGKKREPLKMSDNFGKARTPEVLTSLSEVVRKINDIFGGKFNDADTITVQDWQKLLEGMPELRAMAQANEFSDFLHIFEKRFEQVMIENMEQNTALVTRIFTNPELRQQVTVAAADFYFKWAKANNLPPITPENPWENRSNFRQAIRSCKEHIYWIDRYFGNDGLEFLMDGMDQSSVKEVKILSSLYKNENQINQKLHDAFKTLQEEMKRKGIEIDFRVISTRELYHRVAHDRYILCKNVKYNVPSVDTVKRGQFSEIKKTTADVPFLDWWNDKDSLDLIKDWQNIQALSTFEIKCDGCGKITRFSNFLKGRHTLYCNDCFVKFRK